MNKLELPPTRRATSAASNLADDKTLPEAGYLRRAAADGAAVPDLMEHLLKGGDELVPNDGALIAGTYRVLAEAGRGAMGVVIEALDERLERRVAIKFLAPQVRDPLLHERFLHEARAMAMVRHPQVASIFAFGEHAGLPYFVMEFVEAGTVGEWIEVSGGRPDVPTALSILSDVCDGVSAIHAAGAVHRDIKPRNILLDASMRARVADFGLAARRHEHQQMHEVAGTVAYMAPEIAFSEGEHVAAASPQSDVYALGCVAYEMLTGRVPFDADTDLSIMLQHAVDPVIPPSLVRPELTPAFDLPLARALAKKPQERTASAELFKRELLEARQRYLDPARIIVADDDADFRELLGITLTSAFPEAAIECVDNGRAAVAAFDEDPACVVVLDLDMPDLDGMAVTALLRAREAADRVPIIVLTGSGGPREWQLMSSIGADRFLVKPVHLDDLVATVRRAHQERSTRRES